MLFTHLLTATLETSLNNLFFYNYSMKSVEQYLVDKVLRIELEELTSPLVLVFREKRVEVLRQYEDIADCTIRSRIPTLLKLHDCQKLPVLIQCGELMVEGDIQVVQEWVSLLNFTELDFAEWLAVYIGDIAAQGITKALGNGASLFKAVLHRRKHEIGEMLTEEWRVAVGSREVACFNEEVDDITYSIKILIVRMNQLEGKQ